MLVILSDELTILKKKAINKLVFLVLKHYLYCKLPKYVHSTRLIWKW